MWRGLSMRTLLIICVCMTILYNSISADCNKVAVSNSLIRDNNLPAKEEVVFYLVTPWWIPSIRPWKPWDVRTYQLLLLEVDGRLMELEIMLMLLPWKMPRCTTII
ncbi:uncharacterized protein LOC131068975 [Cryptomeria japonica]|nr:uncharacterized protein LOC131068588 [Cryptomeria japonica]XP_057860249.1 uncharacterized protein LOC131068975 [Cryptomeria japonica]